MAEGNGNDPSRLDRIERLLDLVVQEMTDAQRRAGERMDLSDKRMDRFDEGMNQIRDVMALLANDHIAFRDDHKRLLIAQVVLDDRMKELAEQQTKTAKAVEEMAGAQKEMIEAHNDLIKIVDGIIRARP